MKAAAPAHPPLQQPSGPAQRTTPREAIELYRLYVSAASPISSRAIVNARRFLDQHLPGRHRLVVLNIADNVATARIDQIVASPTLIRLAPLPQRRFIGDMSDVERLRSSLGLSAATGA